MLVLLGMLIAVCVFCVVVAIGCAVNGIGFGQQIAQWFGSNSTETVKETIDVASHLIVG